MGHDLVAAVEIRECTMPPSENLSPNYPFQVFICLHFGTGEGEGGSFALFQGLFPPPNEDVDSDRVLTGESAKPASTSGHISNRFRWPLLAWVSHQLILYVFS